MKAIDLIVIYANSAMIFFVSLAIAKNNFAANVVVDILLLMENARHVLRIV